MLRGSKRDRAGRSGRSVKSIKNRIARIDQIEEPWKLKSLKITLNVPRGIKSHESHMIILKNLTVGYKNGFTMGPVSMSVPFGKRVAILGLNGCGKSTLLKTISGVLPPIAGRVEMGHGVRLGNMMQEHDSLPREQNILNCVMK